MRLLVLRLLGWLGMLGYAASAQQSLMEFQLVQCNMRIKRLANQESRAVHHSPSTLRIRIGFEPSKNSRIRAFRTPDKQGQLYEGHKF